MHRRRFLLVSSDPKSIAYMDPYDFTSKMNYLCETFWKNGYTVCINNVCLVFFHPGIDTERFLRNCHVCYNDINKYIIFKELGLLSDITHLIFITLLDAYDLDEIM